MTDELDCGPSTGAAADRIMDDADAVQRGWLAPEERRALTESVKWLDSREASSLLARLLAESAHARAEVERRDTLLAEREAMARQFAETDGSPIDQEAWGRTAVCIAQIRRALAGSPTEPGR